MARDAELRARITATDDASKVIDKVADAAKDLEKPVEVEVGADAGRALSAFDDLLAEIKQIDAAADALGSALGPELAGKADLRGIVVDLNAMGVGLDEVSANADQFAGKLKELADADVGGKLGANLGTARGKMDELATSAGSSKSVLANMVGNATQDLGALGGMAGSAGVAIGQMGEYMADAAFSGDSLGSIVKNFAGVAAPIAGIAIATQLLSSAFAKGKQAAEAQAKGIERISAAAEEGEGVIGALRDQIEETGKLEFQLGGGFDQSGIKVDDLRENIDNLNMSLDDFIAFSEKSDEAAYAQAESALAAGAAESDWRALLVARAALNKQVAGSELERAINTRIGADATEEGASQQEKASEATERYNEHQEALAVAADAATDALLAEADALNAQVDAALAAADQQLATNDAYAKFGEVLGDAEASAEDVRDAAINLAKSTADLKTSQAAANGVTETATQRLDNQNQALLATGAAAKGPARQGILDYIGSVNQIPPEKITEIQAAIDRGDLAEAQRLLNEASRTRTASVQADADTAQANRELNEAARHRDATIRANVIKGSGWGNFLVPGGVSVSASSAPAVTATAAPVTIDVGLPSAADIARRIGPVKLPFSVASNLRADQRLSGARDL